MSLWSDIGSFLHNTVGHVFGGGSPPPAQPAVQAQVQQPQPGPQVQVQQPQSQQPPAGWNAGRVMHDITHNPVTNFGGDIVKPLLRTGMAVNQGIGNAELAIAGRPTENAQQFFGNASYGPNQLTGYTGQKRQVAGDLLNTTVTAVTPGIGKGVAAGVEKVGGTVLPTVVKKAATGAITGAVTGGPYNVSSLIASNAPITKQNLVTTYKQGTVGGAALGGIAEGAVPAAKLVKNLGLVRPTSLTDAELNASIKIMQAQQGLIDRRNVTSQDSALFHNAQMKLGAKPGTAEGMDAVNKALLAHRSFDMKLQQRQQALKAAGQKVQDFAGDHPIGLGMKDVSNEGGRSQLTGKALETPNEQLASPEQIRIGKALGMSDGQIQAASKPPELGAQPPVTPLQAAAAKQAGMRPKLSQTDRQNLIANDATQHTTNNVRLNVPEGNVKGGIAQAEGVADERLSRFSKAVRAAGKLSADERAKLSDSLNGESVMKNPSQAFQTALSLFKDAYDYSLASDRAAGGTTLRWQHGNYSPLYLQATDEAMDKLGIPPEDRIANGNFHGFRDSSRQFKSYNQAQSAGFKPLYKDAVEDARHYALSGDTPIRQNLLKSAMLQAAPKDAAEIGMGREAANNAPFRQAPGGLPFNASEQLRNQLQAYDKGFNPQSIGGKAALGTLKATNGVTKAALFMGTPFHYANLIKNYLGLTVTTGHEVVAGKGLVNGVFSQLPKAYDHLVAGAEKSGTMDWIRKSGLQLHEDTAPLRVSGVRAKVGGAVNALPLSGKRLSEFTNTLAIQLADAARKHGVDPASPEGTLLAQEYGKVLGLVNSKVAGDSGIFRDVTRLGGLAPQWTRSQLALVKDTATQGGKHGLGLYNAGDVARGTVLGARFVEAATAIIGSAIATGAMPTFKQMLNQAGLNPNNPVPNIAGNSKNSKGEKWVTDLPTDPLGLATGLITDPKHFVQSRLSPIGSAALKVATNQDWNGQALADKSQPGWQVQTAKKIAQGFLPIAAQNHSNPALNPAQALVQDIGGRYKADPNDPQVRATTAYYQTQGAARNGLTPYDQKVYDELHATETDKNLATAKNPTGAVTVSPGQAMANAQLRAQNPNVVQAEANAAKAFTKQTGQAHDPLYDLPLDKQVIVQKLAGIPYKSDQYINLENANKGWLNQLNAQRSQYYNSLPPSTSTKAKNAAAVTYPSLTPGQSTMMNQVSQITVIPTANRTPEQAKQLSSLMGDAKLQSAYAALDQYAQDKIKAEGYTPYKLTPNAPLNIQNFTTNYFAANNAGKQGLKASNPGEYNLMEAYLAQQELSTIDKTASQARIQGNPDTTTQELKDMKNIVNYGLVANGKNLSVLNPQGNSGGTLLGKGGYASSSGSSSGKAYHVNIQPLRKPYIQAHKPFGENRVHVQNWNNRIKFVKSPTSTKIKVGTMSSSKTVKPARAALHKA